MQVNRRTLIFSLLIGVIILCSCFAVYFFYSQPVAGSIQPEATAPEPGDTEPTVPSIGEVPTTIAPEDTPQPALPERRRLTLEYPPKIRAGDSDVVRLTLEVDDLGNLTPTAQIGGNTTTGKI